MAMTLDEMRDRYEVLYQNRIKIKKKLNPIQDKLFQTEQEMNVLIELMRKAA